MTPMGNPGRSIDPPPPALAFHQRADAVAVAMAFNGVEYRAVLEVDGRQMARACDVADMLEALAERVRATG